MVSSKRVRALKGKTLINNNRGVEELEANKSVRGMPWLSETTKDVVSCEKLRGAANKLRSADVRMGQPDYLKNSRANVNPGN